MSSDPTFWIVSRASGLSAYVFLVAAMVLGLALKSRLLTRVRPAAVTDVHRFVALLALGATAVHGTALVVDEAVEIPVQALLVPGLVPYRPLWTGIGVVAAELMLVVYVSFPLRRRIGIRAWRLLHWVTYAAFAAATAHGLLAGTDTEHSWALWLYLASAGVVGGMTAWRALVKVGRTPSRVTQPREQGSTA